MKCTVSQENYLKAIYLLQIQKESVRAVDVSNYMALSKPSVSNALKKLRTERLLTVDKEKNLILTDEGLQAAREIFSRHSFFERLLIDAGVDEGQAHEDACSLGTRHQQAELCGTERPAGRLGSPKGRGLTGSITKAGAKTERAVLPPH